jgi:predicted GNAT family acetyltransferase
MADVKVLDQPGSQRYEGFVGDTLAGYVEYEDVDGERAVRHTEVLDAFEGKGVGSALARGVLDDLRAKGMKVRPFCPFVAGWIRRHPDYLDLVADGYRNRVVAE